MANATSPPFSPAWRVPQAAMLLATGGFLAAVIVRPQTSLALFWGLVVPLLPFTFLVSPLLWRGICPLATLNMLANRPGGGRRAPLLDRWAGAPAMLALAVLVPARHFAFNVRGEALVALVGVAATAAVVLGLRYASRSGFCNFVCPVLPVEQLYGLQPVVQLDNPRCATCSTCTPRGCLDLAGNKAMAQLLGPRRRSTAWLFSAFGLFAVAFPGFVYGYFTVSDVETGEALRVYRHMLDHSVQSLALFGAIVMFARLSAAVALPILGAIAAGIYYWYATPVVLGALGFSAMPAVVIGRLLMGGFIAWWLRRALQLADGRRAPAVASRVEAGRSLPTLSND
jgi:nitrite reductase (NADH) large subunit